MHNLSHFLTSLLFLDIKTTLIYPASDKHIAKYEQRPFYIVEETPTLYNTVTLPHIQKEQFTLVVIFIIL